MFFTWPIDEAPDPKAIPAGHRFGAGRTTGSSPHSHSGVDLGVYGALVRAAAAGRVYFAGAFAELGGPGMVYIDHAGGWQTRYMHVDPDSIAVKKGAIVQAGQPLAKVGLLKEGKAASHLHFEVLQNGTRLDPLAVLAVGGGGLIALAGAAAIYWLVFRG
jgi:murein DD-endopeptidase MepM/ murein hydrolase activator NlpD